MKKQFEARIEIDEDGRAMLAGAHPMIGPRRAMEQAQIVGGDLVVVVAADEMQRIMAEIDRLSVANSERARRLAKTVQRS